jgi:ATP-dependent helicase/nuclease subunit A
VDQEPSGRLTGQQQRAVSCRDVSVVLSSGAGCGKTHVLTQRYLSHLRDDGAEVGQIVAITFTDRAARQMRDRIRRAVLEHVRTAATDEGAERWAAHLRGLETAQISTIHAFCATLLRQFAVEAGLDPNFDVLEDVLSVNLEAEALTACLQRLLTAQDTAGEDLRQLVLLYGWNPVVEAVQQLLRAWDAPGWDAWSATAAGQVAQDWQAHARGVLLPRYIDYLLSAGPKIAPCLALLRRKPPLPGSPMADNVRLLQERLPALAQAPDLAAAVEELTEAAKVGRHGARAWPDPDDYQEAKKALEDFRQELRGQRLEAFAVPPEGAAAAVEAGQRFLRVAVEAVEAYRARKRQHGVVDFQDLLVMARDLLRDREDVRARLQERYRFLLIDELQDTDPVQMQLVESLCGGGLTAGKLFAVGDANQSIYRFRRADVHLFRRLRRQVPHEGRLGLTVNFRSQPAVLDLANALLGRRLDDYEPLVPHHGQVNPRPCVEFLWSPRAAKQSVTESRRTEADWIARRIAAMVDREHLVVERTPEGERLRPVRRGDVVLLFRAMSNVHLYEAALRQHGLDYYLVGGRAFFAQQEIYDLLNLLRALENPQDAVSLAGTLRSPFCCLSDEALFVLSRGRGGLWAGLHDPDLFGRLPPDQRDAADRARRHLDRWRGLKDRLPIAGLLGRVFADSGYDAGTQFEFLGDRKLANLWKLLDLARTFDRSGLFGLAEFIGRLGDLVRSQPREEQAATQPESADVVRLMTIHQAKGLEFPVVFVADVAATGRDPHQPVAVWDPALGCVARPPADEEPPPFPDFGWRLYRAAETVEEWHEDLRTLYVACTRAQDYLVLSAALETPVRPANPWMATLAEGFELQTGACLAPDVAPGHEPRVRVVDGLDGIGAGSGGTAPTAVPAATRGPAGKGGREAGGLPPEVARLSARLRGKRVVAVAELELALRRRADSSIAAEPPLTPADVAFQFAAEDGSDRNTWGRPRDRLVRPSVVGDDPCDQVLRGVLGRWDFRQADGWHALLAEELQADEGTPAAEALHRELESVLRRFARSAVRKQLAGARACHRDVELLAEWPGEEATLGRAGLHGVIDCLWQDEAGAWHLLAFAATGEVAADSDASWPARHPALVLSAWGLHSLHGVWPRSLTLYFLGTGRSVTCCGKRVQQPKLLAAARAALSELRGQVVAAE